MDFEDAMIALGFGFFFCLVILPVIGLMLLSIVDVLARKDIVLAKLVWLGAIAFIPLLGMLLYWSTRPRDFDPYEGPAPSPVLMGFRSYEFSEGPVSAQAPRPAPQPRLTPALQGGADPEPEVDNAA